MEDDDPSSTRADDLSRLFPKDGSFSSRSTSFPSDSYDLLIPSPQLSQLSQRHIETTETDEIPFEKFAKELRNHPVRRSDWTIRTEQDGYVERLERQIQKMRAENPVGSEEHRMGHEETREDHGRGSLSTGMASMGMVGIPLMYGEDSGWYGRHESTGMDREREKDNDDDNDGDDDDRVPLLKEKCVSKREEGGGEGDDDDQDQDQDHFSLKRRASEEKRWKCFSCCTQ
eukprot:TRINITY_DN67937_c0_g1_i1.p1 TRINITY_DN67937_c0_g1~~TRINITY_DN67937_c0_g1_i1.p1  ORF type:complete len:248 (+),score=90.50 TRINITY_DN67937_c0_g1_i1:59-745(+)